MVSEHLADHHGCYGREQGDAQGGERILPLGYRETGDHAGAEAGHGQLGGESGARIHRAGIGSGQLGSGSG